MYISSNQIYTNIKMPDYKPAFGAKSPNISKEQLELLTGQKLKVADICKKLQITTNSYYYLLEKFNIKTPRKMVIEKVSSITKEQLVEIAKSGKKYDEILNTLGISGTTYDSLLAKFNIITDYKTSKDKIAGITKELLQSMVDSGKNVKSICEELKIPQRTYSRLLDKFGILTPRKKAKSHIANITGEQILSLLNQGLCKQEICMKLNITNSMFYKLLKRLNIPYDYLHHAGEFKISKDTLQEALKSGKSVSQIASELGIAVTTLHEKAKINKVRTEFRESIDKIASIDVEKFQNCLDLKMPVKDICKKFDITESTYFSIIRKYNLKTSLRDSIKSNSLITREQIIEMKKANKTTEEICKELNISKSSYKRILNKGASQLK